MLLDVKHFVDKKKEELKADGGKTLGIVEIGENCFDQMFVRGLEKDCKDVGDKVILMKFSENIADLSAVKNCMRTVMEEDVDKILVTCYSPHFEELEELIPQDKSVEPCACIGIVEYLKSMMDLEGKVVGILGEGGPLVPMLEAEGAEVVNYDASKRADILISAVGVRGLIKRDMVKQGCIVVDASVGIDEETGELYGDCDVEMYDPNDGRFAVTTATGGVGLLTRWGVLEKLHG